MAEKITPAELMAGLEAEAEVEVEIDPGMKPGDLIHGMMTGAIPYDAYKFRCAQALLPYHHFKLERPAVQINVNIAERLERARARAGLVIDASPLPDRPEPAPLVSDHSRAGVGGGARRERLP
jgi:hypothetical protein